MAHYLTGYAEDDEYPQHINDWLQRIIDDPSGQFVYANHREWDSGHWNFDPQLHDLVNTSIAQNSLDVNLIYGSAGLTVNAHGEPLHERRLLPNAHAIDWWNSFFYVGGEFASSLGNDWLWDKEPTEFYAKWSCLINRPHEHRIQLLRDIYSLDPQFNGMLSWAPQRQAWEHFLELKESNQILNWFRPILHRLNPDPLQPGMPEYTGINQHEYPRSYMNYCVDIVSESNWAANFYTEKTVKNLVIGKPFIICGAPMANRYLKQMGFELFEEVFDYSVEPTHASTEAEAYGFYKQLLQPLFDIELDELVHIYDTVWRDKCRHNQRLYKEILFNDDHIPECLLPHFVAPHNPHGPYRVQYDVPQARKVFENISYWKNL